MLTLPILPDEIRIPLDVIELVRDGAVVTEPGYPGVVAIITPFDNAQLADWVDAFPTEEARNAAAVAAVRQQLKRIEGLAMRDPVTNAQVAYDHEQHFRSLPTKMLSAIYRKLMMRTSLTEEQEKNSSWPSDSGGTSGSVA